MSYVELYNNTFRNLLSGAGSKSSHAAPAATPTAESGVRGGDTPSMRSTKIEVRESKGAGIFLKGPGVHVSVTSEEEAGGFDHPRSAREGGRCDQLQRALIAEPRGPDLSH